MNKYELSCKLAEAQDISVEESTLVVDAFFKSITDAMLRGDRVELRGFCSWQMRDYKGYVGRNPLTGEHFAVSPKRKPFFKAGKSLLEYINRQPLETEQEDGTGAEAFDA